MCSQGARLVVLCRALFITIQLVSSKIWKPCSSPVLLNPEGTAQAQRGGAAAAPGAVQGPLVLKRRPAASPPAAVGGGRQPTFPLRADVPVKRTAVS